MECVTRMRVYPINRVQYDRQTTPGPAPDEVGERKRCATTYRRRSGAHFTITPAQQNVLQDVEGEVTPALLALFTRGKRHSFSGMQPSSRSSARKNKLFKALPTCADCHGDVSFRVSPRRCL